MYRRKSNVGTAVMAASFAAGLLSTGAASAATASWDFGTLANGNEQGYVEYVAPTINGIALSAFGTTRVTSTGDVVSDPVPAFAYMDGYSSGKPGGLGVCKVLTAGDQCSPSNDDNLSVGEILRLEFSTLVRIDAMTLRDGDHNPLGDNDGLEEFKVSSVSDAVIAANASATNGVADLSGLGANRVGTTFWIQTRILPDLVGSELEFDKIYLETLTVTAVPVPAAAWLFGSGLMGLAGVARKRRTA